MADVYLDYDFTYDNTTYTGSCYCGVSNLPQEELSCTPYLFFAVLHSGIPFPNMYELVGKTQSDLVGYGIWFNNAAVRLVEAG